MSYPLVDAAIACGPVFKASERNLLIAIAKHAPAKDEGEACYPSIGQLALSAGMSKRQVNRILLDLEDLRLVEIWRSAGGRRSNYYTLNADYLERLSEDLKGVKQRARSAGADWFKAVKDRAKAQRAYLIEQMQTHPERGKRWRERRQKAEKLREKHRTRKAAAPVANIDKKICECSGSQGCHDSGAASPDSMESGQPCLMESSKPKYNKSNNMADIGVYTCQNRNAESAFNARAMAFKKGDRWHNGAQDAVAAVVAQAAGRISTKRSVQRGPLGDAARRNDNIGRLFEESDRLRMGLMNSARPTGALLESAASKAARASP